MNKRWIQNPLPPYNLVPRNEYVRPKDFQHTIFGDIQSFVSPVDGSIITGRKGLEEHNRRNYVVNSAEFSPEYCERVQKERKNEGNTTRESFKRKEEINEIINHLTRNPNARPSIQQAEYDYRDFNN